MMALVMKSNYEYFDLPYNGQNRHDLNGAMVGTQPKGGSSGARYYWMLAGTEDADSDGGEGGGPSGAPRRGNKVDGEGNRYYYHSDHLGSSMLITDETGDVTQQLDYLPYGEVFLERRKQDPDVDYFTPYKFNGKELDEETGLYYYGARYMNPRLSIWYGTDPMQEKYPDISSYGYCKNNPVIKVDPLGKECVNSIDENGNKILESNIVVLLEKKREITQDMSAKKRQKIEKENAKIEKRNTELMNHVQQSLSAEFANAKNSKGESVTFKINVIGFETDNPRTTNIEEIIKIARLYAIPAETPELSGRGLLWNDLACPAVLSQAHYNSPDSHGIALRDMLILLGDNKSSTLAHEFGHTLHAEHWTEGLMSSPPDVLSPLNVDQIWEKSFRKK
jgi:RHS repeat-associated protein